MYLVPFGCIEKASYIPPNASKNCTFFSNLEIYSPFADVASVAQTTVPNSTASPQGPQVDRQHVFPDHSRFAASGPAEHQKF